MVCRRAWIHAYAEAFCHGKRFFLNDRLRVPVASYATYQIFVYFDNHDATNAALSDFERFCFHEVKIRMNSWYKSESPTYDGAFNVVGIIGERTIFLVVY